MKILIAGSNRFHQYYRVERALTRATRDTRNRDCELVVIGYNDGADSTALEIADEMGIPRRRAASFAEVKADVCLAFLRPGDGKDNPARITAFKAEKAGMPVWRYYQT